MLYHISRCMYICQLYVNNWGQMTHRCVRKISIFGPDNGLFGRRRVLIWTNTGILLIRTLGTNFSEILIESHTFSSRNGGNFVSASMCWYLNEIAACDGHGDVIKWNHFPRYWLFVRGNPPVTGGFPSQRPVTRSFDFFLSTPDQTVEQTIETPVTYDTIALIITPL